MWLLKVACSGILHLYPYHLMHRALPLDTVSPWFLLMHVLTGTGAALASIATDGESQAVDAPDRTPDPSSFAIGVPTRAISPKSSSFQKFVTSSAVSECSREAPLPTCVTRPLTDVVDVCDVFDTVDVCDVFDVSTSAVTATSPLCVTGARGLLLDALFLSMSASMSALLSFASLSEPRRLHVVLLSGSVMRETRRLEARSSCNSATSRCTPLPGDRAAPKGLLAVGGVGSVDAQRPLSRWVSAAGCVLTLVALL